MNEYKAKLLFVEDDPALALVTKDSLELEGYQVVHCDNGEKGWTAFTKQDFDLCLLDVMLPKLDGFSLAERIREVNRRVPVFFLTAKTLQEDKITGLKIGADDYITKPFSVEELVLRIEIFLKRTRPEGQEVAEFKRYKIEDFEFDFDNLELNHPTEPRHLTLREAEVLRYFCQNANVVMKREDILKKIWGQDDYFMGRSLDVFITRLRKYLKPNDNIKIENIPSVGFKFTANIKGLN
jgi:DNA-binding response OmpR family regulator